MKILITGDIHNNFNILNQLINKKKPELVICCGDFGYWPKIESYQKMEVIKAQGAKILWIDGNHEDHWTLKERTSDEIVPNVIYMPRGSTYNLPDGRKILFMGGGDSIDKQDRILGVDWFPDEIITQKDIYNLPDCKIDILITHTCSNEIKDGKMILLNPLKAKDPSNDALSYVWDRYKPKLWFFGHWHHFVQGEYEGTKWYALSHQPQGEKWFMWLPE
jgi:predicted phosphodiesterase